jgi:glucan phosphoethanolaminetransferase (alkaline phosphatase superfamily)
MGLRFDSFSIVIASSLFILLSIIPGNFFYKAFYQKLLKWTFILPNAIFIFSNCVDVAYYPFIKKRSTSDVFNLIAGQADLGKLLPAFMRDFWWVILCYIVMIFMLVKLYKRISIHYTQRYSLSQPKHWILISLLFILSVGFAVLGARGGLQRIPIDIVNAGSMTKPDEVPIVLNTPFTLIKSAGYKPVEDLHFYPETELKTIFNPIHHFKDSVFSKQNVVVLILESFSKEYTKLGGYKSYTPFLDSLMDKSLVFTNAFSNGTKSIEGIPAILSSLPSLMENPYINSIYANNYQTSFASILKKEGYSTAFFHGGINGTMNFDDWAPLAGYDAYLGKNEYNNNADFDGYWGIWDEPFLQYSVKKMTEMKKPFHAAVFTLSSHHPYFVPEKYKNKFPKGDLENSQSIGYADYALKEFFDSAKKTDWYKNTLFIITADHASLSERNFYGNIVGNLTIPILFFKPDNSLIGTNNHVFSQIDILPSAMSYLGYNKPFFAYGEAFTENKNANDFFYQSGTHYLYSDSLVFCYNALQLNSVFNYKRDSNLYSNLLNKMPLLDSMSIQKCRAFMQTYNSGLIHNSGSLK